MITFRLANGPAYALEMMMSKWKPIESAPQQKEGVVATIAHVIAEDGESTLNWALNAPGFIGTIRQLTDCGRCGEFIKGHPNKPRRVSDVLKPTMHFLCDPCWEALPN